MKKRIQVPCPDNIPGCAVFHFKLEEIEQNQCDGYMRGLPLEDGIYKSKGYDMIMCTAHLYNKEN